MEGGRISRKVAATDRSGAQVSSAVGTTIGM